MTKKKKNNRQKKCDDNHNNSQPITSGKKMSTIFEAFDVI